ncbi:MAG TPA: lactate racemase domain-containing protein [Anaeromyxobacteraceae bacterium]|nr:lactate racemase domain-containing protein [Anaeromyxobacteraceae bacterium]
MKEPSRLDRFYEATDQVVTIERDSPPRVIFSGEDLLLEDLPVGTKVVYPRPPMAGLPNVKAAIRQAINRPEGCEPLHAKLRPGMRVTIALDDISLPLPPMRTPDVRQQVLEVLLPLLADSGVDDVHLVVAVCLHRHMTPAEMKRMVGPAIFDAFYPDRYYNHDAEDPDGIVKLGETRHGEPVLVNRRAAESDLLIYVNLNLVPMDGGHKSVGTGLTSYLGVKAHHTPHHIRKSHSYMDPERSELHRSVDRIGRVIDESLDVFHIETTINNRMFDGPLGFLMKREEQWGELDRLKLAGLRATLERLPAAAKRKIFQAVPAAYEVIAVHAGRTEPTHARILETSWRQYAVDVDFQADVLIYGIPFVSPYNVNSILNPLLVQVMACGYLFNFYRGKPLVKPGGTLILTHPCSDAFDPVHHPSYIEFFHRLLPETRDARVLEEKYEREFAENPTYVHLYRTGHAYHGAHPFFMWYWGENGRQHVGKIIAVGADNGHVPRLLGWDSAGTLAEAIDQARSVHGRGAQIAMLHAPPIVMTQNLG